MYTKIFFIVLFFFVFTQLSFGQVNTRKQLEQRRLELMQEIKDINKNLINTKRSESTALIEYEQIKRKISIRRKLIRNLRNEINYVSHKIKKTTSKITHLNGELKVLKNNYAKMIRQSYNSRSRDSKLYFLFSAENFKQAFKRMQYLKQYATYRKNEGIKIIEKKDSLVMLKLELEKDKASKNKLYSNYKKEEKLIEKEGAKQLEIVNSIKKKKKYFIAKIEAKQREQAKIDKKINDLIANAIAKSNKKVKKSNRKKSQFFLTPEGRKLANQFSSNKGALPWPVKKAYISRKFGVQQHQIFKNIKVENTGIYLATEKGSEARAVFKGVVLQIQLIPGGNNTVFIKHGNYLSIYGNLKEVYVKSGEKVATRQKIGKIATDSNSGKTELKFRIYKNLTKMDPEKWLQKR